MSESFINKPPSNPDEDTVYTMGGLEGLPAPVATAAPTASPNVTTEAPSFDLGQFIGSAAQLAELYPGFQNRPEYEPGLTDIRFTRSFEGLEPGGSFYSPSGAGKTPGPSPTDIVYQQPILQPQSQGAVNEALLGGLFDMDWSGAYQDYLNKLRAQTQDINISNVFNPSNVNYQTQSQQQKQWMGGSGQGQEQDQDDDSQDDFSFQDILDSITNNDSDTDGGVFDDSFFTDVTTGGGNFVDTIKGGNFNDSINLDDIFEGTDTTGGGNYVDTIKGGNFNDSIDLNDWENQQTIDGGNGNDFFVDPGETETEAERQARLAAEEAARRERERVAAEEEARRKAANEQTVKNAYQQVLGRTDVDQEGLDYWTGQLAAGKSPTDLLRDIASGAQGADVQAAQNTDTVSKLYQDLLGRAPDPEGLSYYRSQLAAGASPDDVARNLISGAKAGSEASAISQAEYDRYFPPASTSQPTTGASSNAVNNIFNVTSKSIETANELSRLATDFVNSQIFNPNLMPDEVHAAFIRDVVGSRPELLGDLINDPKYQTVGAEGLAGINTEQLISDLGSAIGSDAYAALNDLIGEAGGSLGEVVSGILAGDNLSEIGGNVVASLAVSTAIDAGAAALASLGIPGAGPFIAGALALDSVLSNALGYDSPIQDGISFIADMTEQGLDWLQDTFGGMFESVGDFFGDIGGWFGDLFAEGGLVDLPGDSMYNANTQGVLPDLMGFARGGVIPLPGGGKIAKGPGGGLDDLIPTSIDGKRAAALSDGEFVIPADVVSMMGDGSTNAGSKRLYDLVRQVRQAKTGTSRQAGPLQVGKILERTMR